MPLHPEQASVGVLERGDLGAGGAAGDPEPRRCDDDGVAVRHPHRLLGGLAGEEHGSGSPWRWCARLGNPVRFTVPPSASAIAWNP